MGMGNTAERYPPNGWASNPCDGRCVEFRRTDGLVVAAQPLDGRVEQPGLSLTGGWEITCKRFIDDQPTTSSIGFVTTRAAALDGLFEVMETINDLSNTDEHAVRSALRQVSLRNTVARPGKGRQPG